VSEARGGGRAEAAASLDRHSGDAATTGATTPHQRAPWGRGWTIGVRLGSGLFWERGGGRGGRRRYGEGLSPDPPPFQLYAR